MASAGVIYREVRFRFDDDLTQVYVLCEATGDAPIGVQGWHHRAFPPTMNMEQIIDKTFKWSGDSNDHPLAWGQEAPRP